MTSKLTKSEDFSQKTANIRPRARKTSRPQKRNSAPDKSSQHLVDDHTSDPGSSQAYAYSDSWQANLVKDFKTVVSSDHMPVTPKEENVSNFVVDQWCDLGPSIHNDGHSPGPTVADDVKVKVSPDFCRESSFQTYGGQERHFQPEVTHFDASSIKSEYDETSIKDSNGGLLQLPYTAFTSTPKSAMTGESKINQFPVFDAEIRSLHLRSLRPMTSPGIAMQMTTGSTSNPCNYRRNALVKNIKNVSSASNNLAPFSDFQGSVFSATQANFYNKHFCPQASTTQTGSMERQNLSDARNLPCKVKLSSSRGGSSCVAMKRDVDKIIFLKLVHKNRNSLALNTRPCVTGSNDFVDPTEIRFGHDDDDDEDNSLKVDDDSADEEWKPYKMDDRKKSGQFSGHTVTCNTIQKQKAKGGKQVLACSTCGKHFRGKYLLKRHEMSHTEDRPYVCSVCDKSFKQKAHLYGHLATHKKVTASEITLTECSTKVSQNVQPAKCPGRPRKMYTEKDLSCKMCGKSFKTVYRLKRHEQSHTDIRPYTCQLCGKGFKQSGHRNEHEANHEKSNKTRFLCNTCGVVFRCRSSFNNHRRSHNTEVTRLEQVASTSADATDGAAGVEIRHSGYDCPYCTDKFATAQALNSHLDSHVEVKHRRHVQPYSCDVCRRTFTYKHNLVKHKLAHKAPEKFAQFYKEKVEAHMASGKPLFRCLVCAKVFIRKETLAKHFKLHSGKKPFKCSICNRDFTQNVHLKVHMRKHTGSRPFQCKECHRGFIDSTALAKHIEYEACNSEYALYRCRVCSKRHYYLGSIKQHIRKVHNVVNEEDIEMYIMKFERINKRKNYGDSGKYVCMICDRHFTEKCNLIRHVRNKHSDLLQLLSMDRMSKESPTGMCPNQNIEDKSVSHKTSSIKDELMMDSERPMLVDLNRLNHRDLSSLDFELGYNDNQGNCGKIAQYAGNKYRQNKSDDYVTTVKADVGDTMGDSSRDKLLEGFNPTDFDCFHYPDSHTPSGVHRLESPTESAGADLEKEDRDDKGPSPQSDINFLYNIGLIVSSKARKFKDEPGDQKDTFTCELDGELKKEKLGDVLEPGPIQQFYEFCSDRCPPNSQLILDQSKSQNVSMTDILIEMGVEKHTHWPHVVAGQHREKSEGLNHFTAGQQDNLDSMLGHHIAENHASPAAQVERPHHDINGIGGCGGSSLSSITRALQTDVVTSSCTPRHTFPFPHQNFTSQSFQQKIDKVSYLATRDNTSVRSSQAAAGDEGRNEKSPASAMDEFKSRGNMMAELIPPLTVVTSPQANPSDQSPLNRPASSGPLSDDYESCHNESQVKYLRLLPCRDKTMYTTYAMFKPWLEDLVPESRYKRIKDKLTSSGTVNLEETIEQGQEIKSCDTAENEAGWNQNHNQTLLTLNHTCSPSRPVNEGENPISPKDGRQVDKLAAVVTTAPSKTFLSKTLMTSTLESWATSTFSCSACAKTFRARHQLKRHELTHTDLRPYSCEKCGKAFRQKVHLSDHMKRHQGVRPFACEGCGKRFVLKNEMNQHIKNHCKMAAMKAAKLATGKDQQSMITLPMKDVPLNDVQHISSQRCPVSHV